MADNFRSTWESSVMFIHNRCAENQRWRLKFRTFRFVANFFELILVPSKDMDKPIRLAVRFAYHGCTNRPFFHIVLANTKSPRDDPPMEHLGSYDPLPNQDNQKLVALNMDRIKYWIGQGAETSQPVAELLGLAGLLPIHPNTFKTAWRNRWAAEKEKQPEKPDEASASPT